MTHVDSERNWLFGRQVIVEGSIFTCICILRTYHSISESKLIEQSLCSGRERGGGGLACMDWLFAFCSTLTAGGRREEGGGRERVGGREVGGTT